MINPSLSEVMEERLTRFARLLMDQERATTVIPPYQSQDGFWFGGGNAVRDASGRLLLVGRYRNFGDSRTGLEAGARGLELAIFVSDDDGASFQKLRSWSKADLSRQGRNVLSIEGAALRLDAQDAELFVSSEKQAAYPGNVAAFQKPGTGVWSIDVMRAGNVDALDVAQLEPLDFGGVNPAYLHIKDPVVFDPPDGATVLVFCTHPYNWTSANTAYAMRAPGQQTFTLKAWQMVERGPAWDVAGTRVTARLRVPATGAFADLPLLSLYFYDGLECVRQLDVNPRGVDRPRGYSCEEIGGVLYGFDEDFPRMKRLSLLHPLFVSPRGTGCSRYVDVHADERGFLATWQQGQDDGSQPLVGRFVSMDEARECLA